MMQKVLMCSERLLGRFGADRVMLNLAGALQQSGRDVQLLSIRMDESLVPKGIRYRTLNLDSYAYAEQNEAVAALLGKDFSSLADFKPDVTIVAGWPFYASLPQLKSRSRVVFIDFGAVPWKGFRGIDLRIQVKLRLLRRKFLNEVDRAIPISDFIAHSQTILDVEDQKKIHTILLGADHLLGEASDKSPSSEVARSINREIENGYKLILFLGRFETNNYKQGELVFPFADLMGSSVPFKIVMLAEQSEIQAMGNNMDRFLCTGRVSDVDLAYIYSKIACGVCFSSWEGFNLNIAESQSFQKPGFCLQRRRSS